MKKKIMKYTKKKTGECDLQSEKKQKSAVRVLDVIFNGFKAAIINMFKN